MSISKILDHTIEIIYVNIPKNTIPIDGEFFDISFIVQDLCVTQVRKREGEKRNAFFFFHPEIDL